MATMGPPPPQTESATSRSSRLWPLAVVAVVAMILATVVIFKCANTPKELMQEGRELVKDGMNALAEAFKTDVHYTTVITGAISSLKNNPKLVVLTAEIDAVVKRSASTEKLWIYWGTTTVEMRTKGNKVQFYIPLDDIGTHSFRYDSVHKTLTILTHPPMLDEDFVDVQSDPSKIEMLTSNGWAKFDKWSGAPMREDARRELRGEVLRSAKHPAQHELLMSKAKTNAKEHLKRLLEPSFAESLNPETKIEIEFLP